MEMGVGMGIGVLDQHVSKHDAIQRKLGSLMTMIKMEFTNSHCGTTGLCTQ